MKNNLVKSSAWVTIILVIGYIISFVKEAVIANFYGVSADVDAYTIAITIPVTLFALVSVSIQSIVIPLYSNSLYNEGKEVADKNISNLLSVVSIVALCFIIFCEVFAGIIIKLFAPGFSPETNELASTLLRITAPTILFSIIDKIFIGLLNVHKKFVWPALSVYVLNIGLIVTVVLLHAKLGISAACIGQVIGSCLQVLFMILIGKKVFHFYPVLSFKDVFIMKAAKQSVPIIWSISIAEINAMINRMVASFLFVGSISALGYASKVNSVMLQFFTQAIATIVYPLYAESSAKKDMVQLGNRVNLTLSIYTFFLIPLMVGVFCFRGELIDVAFSRGAFDQKASDLTKTLLGLYTIGMLFMAFRETVTKVFYSLNDTKTPAKNATLGICLNIILNLSLPFILGVNGLALATSITAMFISTRLLYQLVKKHKMINLGAFKGTLPGISISAFVMGCVILLQRMYLPINNSLLQLIIGAFEGVLIYGLICFLMKSPTMDMIFNLLFHKKLFKRNA